MKKRRKKRKLNKKKFLTLMLLFILIMYFYIKDNNKSSLNPTIKNNLEYANIKQDVNENYSGIGQTIVEDKDGYFTTFTTINKKVYKEYKQNGNSSWANKSYWGGTMEENGCGITSIAIILSGYNKDYTPEYLRTKYYPVLDGEKISEELSKTFGIKNTDFYFDSPHLSKDEIQKHLETDRPILICVWNKPTENRWTISSHYMVLLATDGKDNVYISNPNRR